MRNYLSLTLLCVIGVVAHAAEPTHQRLITLDTHLDTPVSLERPGWSIRERHDVHVDYTQVDLPRMKAGGLDGGFWAIYTPQGPLDAAHYRQARDFAVMRGLAIRAMVAANPADFALALLPEDAARIAAQHQRIVYISIENAYPLGEDISLLSLFQKMGVRMLGFAHFSNNQFADSSTDPGGPHWGGLSPLGRQLLAEANRLGLVLDASHSSDAVLDEMLALSKAPIILSHSGCKAVYDHPRNIDDVRLRALAAKGGVIQINAFGSYLRAAKPNPERQQALRSLYAKRGESFASDAEYQAFLAARREIDQRYPDTDRPSFDDFMAHLLHALTVVGPEHVGIGLDWDGGGGVAGMEDVSAIPKITAALRKAGYTDKDLANIWSGNALRVLAAAEAARER
jgi:membrane dipeptidase